MHTHPHIRFQERHKYKTMPTKESIEARMEKWSEEIRKMEVDIRNRDENKEVALGMVIGMGLVCGV